MSEEQVAPSEPQAPPAKPEIPPENAIVNGQAAEASVGATETPAAVEKATEDLASGEAPTNASSESPTQSAPRTEASESTDSTIFSERAVDDELPPPPVHEQEPIEGEELAVDNAEPENNDKESAPTLKADKTDEEGLSTPEDDTSSANQVISAQNSSLEPMVDVKEASEDMSVPNASPAPNDDSPATKEAQNASPVPTDDVQDAKEDTSVPIASPTPMDDVTHSKENISEPTDDNLTSKEATPAAGEDVQTPSNRPELADDISVADADIPVNNSAPNDAEDDVMEVDDGPGIKIASVASTAEITTSDESPIKIASVSGSGTQTEDICEEEDSEKVCGYFAFSSKHKRCFLEKKKLETD